MIYSIPEVNMESLEKKLKRIEKKCAKYGCDFKYERLGERFEEIDLPKYDEFGEKVGTYKAVVKLVDVEVEGKAVVNGWRFAASLEYTDKGNIICGSGGVEVPDRYYDCEPWCEHCKTKRDRKYSFIVFNEESGEFKQVGKACLKDYTGGLSAEGVAIYESYFKEIEMASEDYGGYRCGGHEYFEVDELMVYAAEMIRIYGYVRSQDAGISTICRATDAYRVDHGMWISRFEREAVQEEYDDAVSKGFNPKRQESVDLARAVKEWIVNNERDDNYYHNLKVACSMEYCDGHSGLLVSAFPAYNRDLEFQAEKRERERKMREEGALSKHVGEVGKRVSFKPVDRKVLTSWETMYGVTMVYKFVDESGNVFIWKTGKWVDDEMEIEKMVGTVKEHKEYRGVKQTELTRCKVEYVPRKKKVQKEPTPEELEASKEAQESIYKAINMMFDWEVA